MEGQHRFFIPGRMKGVLKTRPGWISGVLAATFLILSSVLLIACQPGALTAEQVQATQQVMATQKALTQATNQMATETVYAPTLQAKTTATALMSNATATVAARKFPFSTKIAFHDDLSKASDQWLQKAGSCSFLDNTYKLEATDKDHEFGCQRQYSSFNDFSYEIVVKDLASSDPKAAVGLLFNASVTGLAGTTFEVDKQGDYDIHSISTGLLFAEGKTNTAITFPLRIGMTSRSHACAFYINGQEVFKSSDSRVCGDGGQLGVSISSSKPATAHFTEATAWSL